MQYALDLQLDVDASAGDVVGGQVAFRWLDEMSQALLPDGRAEIADLPARVAKTVRPYGPQGAPGSLFGIVYTDRELASGRQKVAQRNASAAGMRWLRGELAEVPRKTQMWFGRLDDEGHRSGSLVSLQAERMPQSPDWLRLSVYLPEMTFLDPIDGPAWQRRYLNAVFALADEWNPGFGHVAYALDYGQTAYEACLRRIEQPVRQETWDARYTVNECRQFLRGYSWLTIVPEELALKLVDPTSLAKSGAFADVRPLARGGVWLLATQDYRDFDDVALRRVRNVVTPLLRPGRLTNWPRHRGQPPLRVILDET